MKNKGSLGRRRAVIQAILHYLIKNPDAKDTIEGVRTWWLPEGYQKQRQEELEETIDFLVSKNWLTLRMTSHKKKIYGLNKDFCEQVMNYLNDSNDQD